MWQVGLTLCVLCAGAAILRDRCIFGVSAALLANWIINTVMVRSTGDASTWGVFLTVDYLSGIFILLALPLLCGRFTAGAIVIALSYALECVVHASYGLSDHGAWAAYRYWWTTFYIALAQMLFVVGWGLFEIARRFYRARRGVAPDVVGVSGRGPAPSFPES
jgi:hypothetical protein